MGDNGLVFKHRVIQICAIFQIGHLPAFQEFYILHSACLVSHIFQHFSEFIIFSCLAFLTHILSQDDSCGHLVPQGLAHGCQLMVLADCTSISLVYLVSVQSIRVAHWWQLCKVSSKDDIQTSKGLIIFIHDLGQLLMDGQEITAR